MNSIPPYEVYLHNLPIAFLRITKIEDDILQVLIDLCDFEGESSFILSRETIAQLSRQEHWWSEGDLPEPGEPVDYRKYLHTYFQALLESMGDAELIFLL